MVVFFVSCHWVSSAFPSIGEVIAWMNCNSTLVQMHPVPFRSHQGLKVVNMLPTISRCSFRNPWRLLSYLFVPDRIYFFPLGSMRRINTTSAWPARLESKRRKRSWESSNLMKPTAPINPYQTSACSMPLPGYHSLLKTRHSCFFFFFITATELSQRIISEIPRHLKKLIPPAISTSSSNPYDRLCKLHPMYNPPAQRVAQ